MGRGLPVDILGKLGRMRRARRGQSVERLLDTLDRAPSPMHFWWRDDDAGRANVRLDRLLALAEAIRVPVALSVVPSWLELDVVRQLRSCEMAMVLQHGWSHNDNAFLGEHPIEIGGVATLPTLRSQLAEGRARLEQTFGNKFQPVLVPPWNLIADQCIRMVDGLRFGVVSAAPHTSLAGLATPRRDVHVDLVYWFPFLRHIPGMLPYSGQICRCRGIDSIAAEIAGHIEARQLSPIGLMTHHQLMQPQDFVTLERVLTLLRDHPKVRWLTAGGLIADTRRQASARTASGASEPVAV